MIRVGGDHPRTDDLLHFITHTFTHARLKERHFNMLEFDMPMAQTVLSKVFGTMESQRQRFCIEDYSISQTTLDQVCFPIWNLKSIRPRGADGVV